MKFDAETYKALEFHFQVGLRRILINPTDHQELIQSYKLDKPNAAIGEELKQKVKAGMASPQKTGAYRGVINRGGGEAIAMQSAELTGLIVLVFLGELDAVSKLVSTLKEDKTNNYRRQTVAKMALNFIQHQGKYLEKQPQEKHNVNSILLKNSVSKAIRKETAASSVKVAGWDIASWIKTKDFNAYYGLTQPDPPGILLYRIITGHRSPLEPELNYEIRTLAYKGLGEITLSDLVARVLDKVEKSVSESDHLLLSVISAIVKENQATVQQIGGDFACYRGEELVCEPYGLFGLGDKITSSFAEVLKQESVNLDNWKRQYPVHRFGGIIHSGAAEIRSNKSRIVGNYCSVQVALPDNIPLILASPLLWTSVDEPIMAKMMSDKKQDSNQRLQNLGELNSNQFETNSFS